MLSQFLLNGNNGITITVDDYSMKNNKINLEGAQIVNGAQTSKSILDRKKKTKQSERGHFRLLVIKTKDEKTSKKISRKYRKFSKCH